MNNFTEEQTFLPAALDSFISTKGKINTNSKIAALAQAQPHGEVANQVFMAFVSTRNTAAPLRRAGQQHLVALNPEAFLNFIEALMNKVCWHARRLMRAQDSSISLEEAGEIRFGAKAGPSVTPDWSELTSDDLDVVAGSDPRAVLTDDYRVLADLYNAVKKELSYIDDVHGILPMYTDRGPDPADKSEKPVWIVHAEAYNFDDALSLMKGIIETLDEKGNADLGTFAQTHVFGDPDPRARTPVSDSYRRVGSVITLPTKPAVSIPLPKAKQTTLFARLFG